MSGKSPLAKIMMRFKIKHPHSGGCLMQIEKSLRQYDLDQVMRVERGSLLSVPHRGTPRSVVESVIKLVGYFVNKKISSFSS